MGFYRTEKSIKNAFKFQIQIFVIILILDIQTLINYGVKQRNFKNDLGTETTTLNVNEMFCNQSRYQVDTYVYTRLPIYFITIQIQKMSHFLLNNAVQHPSYHL